MIVGHIDATEWMVGPAQWPGALGSFGRRSRVPRMVTASAARWLRRRMYARRAAAPAAPRVSTRP